MLKDDNFIKITDLENFDSDNLETVLHKILSHIKITTNCDAGSIYLKKDNYLHFSIFQNDSFTDKKIVSMQQPIKKIKLPITEDSGILAIESFLQSKIIMADDIYNDIYYDFKSIKEFDKKFNYKTTSILTAPLMDTLKKETIGIVQLINKKDNTDGSFIPFNTEDEKFISLSSYLIAISIINVKNNMEELRKHNLELEQKVKERTKELLATQAELREQAHKDQLTSLYNRRHFAEIKENLFSISQRGKNPLSILIIDIDNFKTINDTYGHNTGDLVIKTLSNIFINTIRKSDIAIRYGGEEFLILLTNTNLENAHVLAEKLRKNVENTHIKILNSKKLNFTISLGLSMVRQDDKSIELSIEKADKGLYIAKNSGKNKTISH